jgi:hypothetical protein
MEKSWEGQRGHGRTLLVAGHADIRTTLVLGVAACQIFAAPSGARAADLDYLAKLAQFQRGLGLIESYDVSEQDHALDLRIIPATPLPTGEAGSIGRATCSLGMQRFGGNLLQTWSVRVFLPDQAAPAFACEIRALVEPPSAPARSLRRRARTRNPRGPVPLPSSPSRLQHDQQ